MKCIVATSIVSMCLVSVTPALADWRGTAWGMSPQEVAAAVSGAEIAEGKGEAVTYGDTDTYWKTVTADVAWGDATGETGFLFKERTGLQRVNVEFTAKSSCDALLAALKSEFGEPTKTSGIEGADFISWTVAGEDSVQYMRFTRSEYCSGSVANSVKPEEPEPKPVADLTPEPEATVGDDGETLIGAWTVTEDKSPFDDSASIFAFLEAPNVRGSGVGRAELSVLLRCHENTTNVLLSTSMFMTDRPEVMYRIDDQDAVVQRMSVSANGRATGFWTGSSAIPFIRSLYNAEKLAIRVSEDSFVEAVFDLTGIRTVADRVSAACNWRIQN